MSISRRVRPNVLGKDSGLHLASAVVKPVFRTLISPYFSYPYFVFIAHAHPFAFISLSLSVSLPLSSFSFFVTTPCVP